MQYQINASTLRMYRLSKYIIGKKNKSECYSSSKISIVNKNLFISAFNKKFCSFKKL